LQLNCNQPTNLATENWSGQRTEIETGIEITDTHNIIWLLLLNSPFHAHLLIIHIWVHLRLFVLLDCFCSSDTESLDAGCIASHFRRVFALSFTAGRLQDDFILELVSTSALHVILAYCFVGGSESNTLGDLLSGVFSQLNREEWSDSSVFLCRCYHLMILTHFAAHALINLLVWLRVRTCHNIHTCTIYADFLTRCCAAFDDCPLFTLCCSRVVPVVGEMCQSYCKYVYWLTRLRLSCQNSMFGNYYSCLLHILKKNNTNFWHYYYCYVIIVIQLCSIEWCKYD